MSNVKKQATFASASLDHHKEQFAAVIRKEISSNNWKYPVAEEIFGLSGAAVSRIMNYKEKSMSFETLYNAVVTAGMIVSITLTVPN